MQILLLAKHVSCTTMPIIRSSRVLHIQWLLPVVFRAVVFKLLVSCGAEGYVSGLQDAAGTLVTMDIPDIWDVIPRTAVDTYQHFRGRGCFHLQGR